MSKGKLRIVSKKRFVISILSITLLLFLSIGILFDTNVAEGSEMTQIIEIQVKQGDTLWGLAKTFGHNKDIRKTIFEISTINNLTSLDIYPGQIIKIPLR